MNFIFDTPTEAFETLYDFIKSGAGVDTEIGTQAIYNVGFTIRYPMKNIITTPWRKFNLDYAKAEWEWYLSGNRNVEQLAKRAKLWNKMHDGNYIVNSNYGYQWNRNAQLRKCIEQLKNDKNTRQAWLTIFDGKEKGDYAYDTPCTLNIGFRIDRDNRLCMTVIMRSNDLVYGFCNDQYCFSNLMAKVAKELGVEIGTYSHYAADLHIYKNLYNNITNNVNTDK